MIDKGGMRPMRRVRRYALGTTAMTVAVMLAGPAAAQCTPDPTVVNNTTVCRGTDSDGLRVTTFGTTVSIEAGATVRGGNASAIELAVPSDFNYGIPVSVLVAGLVDGGTNDGIAMLAPVSSNGFSSYRSAALTVAAGGRVTGDRGVVIADEPFRFSNSTIMDIDNSGTITGTGGIALLATGSSAASFGSIVNRAGGVIGAIVGTVGALTNAGTISGGSRSAIAWRAGSYGYGQIANSGTIDSTSSDATLSAVPASRSITNSGTIANNGTGAAIEGEGRLTIVNAATGRIASAGGTAITAAGALQLTNAGTITGDVVAAANSASDPSVINSTAGRITGSLRLGAGADTLVARYDAGQLDYGIDGAIDGGSGTDTVRVAFAAAATLASTLVLPTAFEQVELAPDSGVTVTLATGFALPGMLRLAGYGTVVNRGVIGNVGQSINSSYDPFSTPSFVNAGSVLSTVDSDGAAAAVALTRFNRFENSGTITATRNAVSFNGTGTTVTNSGTIVAGRTAMLMSAGTLTNTGQIRSTGGTGLMLDAYSYGQAHSNSGLIAGATGVDLYNRLVNSGTIAGTETGVVLRGSATLDNRAGGTVSGPVAVTARPASGFNGSSTTVSNAGTITGDVVLGGATPLSFYPSYYFALPGGTLDGNLTLGAGNVLVTELENSGTGAFAGINGTVDAQGGLLRLRVRRDATVMSATPAGFGSVGYDLLGDPAVTLTLTGGAGGQPLLLAGRGSVDTAMDIAVTDRAAIRSTFALTAPGEAATATALTITSRGVLSGTRANGGYPYDFSAVVAVGGSDSFVNAGSIAATDRVENRYYPLSAISGAPPYYGNGSEVTNNGTITLDGANGITDVSRITNNGSIVQAVGGRAATGILLSSYFNNLLVNTGTIDVGGVAVLFNYISGTINNSGRIASAGTAAIMAQEGYSVVVNNSAGGTIVGGSAGGIAIRMGGNTVNNAGTITGTVDLGYSTFGYPSYTSGQYVADGGTISGDLLFGSGSDTLVTFGAFGVSGRIDGGAGEDTLILARRSNDTVTLGLAGTTNFEAFGVRAVGVNTVVTARADAALDGDLDISGDGAIVNTVDVGGSVRVRNFAQTVNGVGDDAPILARFENSASIGGGFFGVTRAFVNTGTISAGANSFNPSVLVQSNDTLVFDNRGTIRNTTGNLAAVFENISGNDIAGTNSGTIDGGLLLQLDRNNYYYPYYPEPSVEPLAVSFNNTDTVTAGGFGRYGVALGAALGFTDTATVTLTNSGTITATGRSATAASLDSFDGFGTSVARLIVANDGTIRANAGGIREYDPFAGASVNYDAYYIEPAVALSLRTESGGSAQVTNGAAGTIEATGAISTAVLMSGGSLDLANAGTIRGGSGTTLSGGDYYLGLSYLAGAIQADDGDDRVVNTGSIFGSIDLGGGADRIENLGRIEGDVFLRGEDDVFLQRASASLVGTVDAGSGDDLFIVDATGGGAVNGDQFVNFERFSQIGVGNVAYSGTFRFNTVNVMGGTVTVAAGQTLASNGPVAITGSDAAETVNNDGTIDGGLSLGGGDDRVVNRGTINGAVLLGDGDDSFAEGPNGRVTGTVDGGAGSDIYVALLDGDRSGLAARTGFERLGVEGNGTLALTLDQRFDTVSLIGTGLQATLNGFAIGRATGSDGSERLAVDGDIGAVSLGAGDDTLALGTVRAAGRYDGGAGNDLLRFTATGGVTLAGVATGFERVSLAGGSLTVAGTLGSIGGQVAFGDGAQTLLVASGGTLGGVIDLGDGNDAVRFAAGSTLAGTVAGGAGTDSATLELAGDRQLAAAMLSGFETLATEGRGTLTLGGVQAYDRIDAATDLAVAADAALAARQVRFGAGDQRFTIAGGFAGSVDGGAGTDTLVVSGGSAATPVAFADLAAIETLAVTAGYATLSGTAALGTVDVLAGRFAGLAGSTITAGQIGVRAGATFGSTGTVNGNLAVAGTLAPGVVPGTMTVNGNVAIGAGSVTALAITPTAQDSLVVNGTVQIANGATLQLTPTGAIRPGSSYDLVTASGGITGSYSTVVKPDTLFGFVVQRADRIQLLGQFLGDAAFAPQVTRAIDYTNTVLQQQPTTSPLFAALPSLLAANGASDPRAFARLTPEPYASAVQMGVENGLALADVARGPGFAANRTAPGAFTFGQAIGSWYRLGAEATQGVSATRTSSYGFLGGIGYGDRGAAVGAFGGYLDSRQRIDALGVRTGVGGWVAGVQARYEGAGFGLGGSVAYNAGTASTRRALPGTAQATAGYDLNSWVADVLVQYTAVTGDWALRPHAGITYVRTSREGFVEAGGPFALTVARDRHVAGFADAGIGFGRDPGSDARLQPFVNLGVRYQIEGRRADALAGFAGGPLGLAAVGASRTRTVGIASAGLAYRLTPGLDLFSTAAAQTGRDDHRETVSTGMRLRF